MRHVREDLLEARALIVAIQAWPGSAPQNHGPARDYVHSALQRAARRVRLPQYGATELNSFVDWGVDWDKPIHVQRLIDCFDVVLGALTPEEEEDDFEALLIRGTSLWVWLTWPFRIWSRLGGWKGKLWFVVVPAATALLCHAVFALEPKLTVGITGIALTATGLLLKD